MTHSANPQADAEEVVQDAFWTVVRKIDTFKGDSAFSSWLYRIVANAAYNKLRNGRGWRGECSLDELSATGDKHGDSAVDLSSRIQDPAIQTDLRIALTAAIRTLPEEYRTVVVLRDVEGLSTQEISRITGLTIANVKARTHRARLVPPKRLEAYLSAVSVPPAGAPVPRTHLSRTGARAPSAGRAAGLVTDLAALCPKGHRRAAPHTRLREEVERTVRSRCAEEDDDGHTQS